MGEPSISVVQRAGYRRKRCRGNREGFGRSWRRDDERVGGRQEKPVIKGESDNENGEKAPQRGVPWE